jgi:hypothetical protein
MPSLRSSSSSSSLSDDELILTPATPTLLLLDEEAIDAVCKRYTDGAVSPGMPPKPLQPVVGTIQQQQAVGYVDELDPLRPYTMAPPTWAGGWSRWKRPMGDGSKKFDVRGWCVASTLLFDGSLHAYYSRVSIRADVPEERHDQAALAGEKTFTPKPAKVWRTLRIVNYLFWLSAFLALAGYLFRLVVLLVTGVCDTVRVAFAFYFVVATSIYTVGFP